MLFINWISEENSKKLERWLGSHNTDLWENWQPSHISIYLSYEEKYRILLSSKTLPLFSSFIFTKTSSSPFIFGISLLFNIFISLYLAFRNLIFSSICRKDLSKYNAALKSPFFRNFVQDSVQRRRKLKENTMISLILIDDVCRETLATSALCLPWSNKTRVESAAKSHETLLFLPVSLKNTGYFLSLSFLPSV